MNDSQTRKLRSHLTTKGLLQSTPATSEIPGLPALLTQVTAKLGEINTLAMTQTQPTAGRTARRNQQLAAMTDSVLDLANALAAYAHQHARAELVVLADINASAFEALRLSHRPWLAQRLVDAAQAELPALAEFGVTAETLAATQGAIEAVKAGLDEPRSTITEKRAATERLAVVFAELDTLFDERIDRLIFPLRKSEPEFYAHYRAARSVDAASAGRAEKPVELTSGASAASAAVAAGVTPLAAAPVTVTKAAA